MTRDQEIADLQDRLARAQQRIDELTAPPIERIGNMSMPTAGEYAQLLKIVLAKYGVLKTADPDFMDQFIASFRYLAQVSRTDKMCPHSNSTWCDRVYSFSRTSVTTKPFAAAVVAHNAFEFVIDNFPHSFAVAAVEGGHNLLDGSAYRAVLNGGALKSATLISYPNWSMGRVINAR